MRNLFSPFLLGLSLCIAMPVFAQNAPLPAPGKTQNAAREVQGAGAAPDNPKPEGAFDVREFGALGDAKNDDTSSFQAALNAAGKGEGVVFVPAGQYRLNGSLDVPAGVTLEGTWRGPHTSHLSIGTTLFSYGGRGDENATPFINLHAGSTLKGVTIYYPEQTVTVPDATQPPVVQGSAPPHWTLPVGSPASDAWIRGEWGSGPDMAQEWPDYPDTLMRWTGARPIIYLPVLQNREYSLRIFASVRPQSLKSGSNEVLVNGRVLGKFEKAGPQVLTLKIPAALIGTTNLAKLEMHAGTWRPADGGSTDPRTLGIALRQVEIIAAGAENTPPGEAQLPAPDIGVVPYPWTIQGRGQQYNVLDVTIVNAWNGIDCGTFHNEGHHLRNVMMCALRRGVLVDQCTDIGRLENVHIHSVFWWRANAPGVPLQEQATFFSNEKINALNTFTQANLEGFIFGRTDWEYVNNSFVIWANVGMKFVQTSTPIGGVPNVLVTQSGSDISIYAARVIGSQAHAGISFTNAQMNGIVQIEKTNEGPVKFTGSSFYGSGNVDSNVVSDGRGRVSFDNCHFTWWDQNARDAPAIHARGGVLGVSNSEFIGPKNHVVLEKEVRAATIVGNYFHGAMRVENKSGGKVQIGLNADSPPAPPTVLKRRFYGSFEKGQPQPFLERAEIVAHPGKYALSIESDGRAGKSGRALVLRGSAVDTIVAPSRAYFRVFEDKIAVRPETVLRYWIRADSAEAQHAGIDLVFDDGTALRDSPARDTDEHSLHPSQPKGEIGKWTRIESPIGQWLAGKTITAILAAHDGVGTDAFRVSFDDIEIGDAQ